MASAAAVGADTAETPLHDVDDELGTSGFVGPARIVEHELRPFADRLTYSESHEH